MDDLHDENTDQLKESLGCLLKRTRKSQHKTLAEAAESTRIHIHSLQALEEDDFEKLPAEAFVRGFIKLYSSYLGLDQQQTLSHFASQEDTDVSRPADTPYRHDILDGEVMAEPLSLIKKNGKIITVTLLLAILVLFYVLGIFFKSADRSRTGQTAEEVVESLISSKPDTGSDEFYEKTEEPISQESVQTIAESESVAIGQTEDATESTLQEKQPEKEEKTVTGQSPQITTKHENTQKATPQATTVNPGALSLPVTVKVSTEKEIKYRLEANFEESSFVSVKVDDKPEKKYRSQAGIVRVWKAFNNISLILDNPSAVSLTLNGVSIPASYFSDPASGLQVPAGLPDNLLP